ncbi:hypothetical protein ON010_g14109 [Phytophthora cinnamomi]|nr:hypothetical protein ON010_g14109 [Phytophthora cinnamomi]
MPGSRLAKTVSEKKEVVTWIEEHREVPSRAARTVSLTNGNHVAQWVETTWKDVPDDVVTRSVAAAGFAPCYQDWNISRHDFYGELFCRKWLSRDDDSDDNDVEEDLLENLDEFTIWDSEDSVQAIVYLLLIVYLAKNEVCSIRLYTVH